MTKSSRALIALGLIAFFIWSMAVRSDASEGHDKENATEKTVTGATQASPASDGQSAPAKPSPEVKSPPPAVPKAKGETATEHKEGEAEKPASNSSQTSGALDSQPVPKPPAGDAKPQSQTTPVSKGEAAVEHKEDKSEKPASAKPLSDMKPPSPGTPKAKAEATVEHKEDTQEKSVPAKPSPEAKPQPQPTTSPTPKSEAAPDHKEVVPKKPASDGQSVQTKPASETKSLSPATPKPKSEAVTEHKDSGSDKLAPTKPLPDSKTQPQAAPMIKADLPPDGEIKDREPALRKTLGSLILSVKLALMGDFKLFHYEIEVEDDQQTVTLSGRVSTEEEKMTAKEVAQKVPGVKNVINKLAVEKDLAKALSKRQDDTLTSLIKERFAKSATLKAANFDVKTEDGVVLLDGTVRFQVIALEAAEAARQVPGVRAVNTDKVRLEGES